MRVLHSAQAGDIVAFKKKGPVSFVLSLVIGLFEPSWRQRAWKPWHLAVVLAVNVHTYDLIEAIAGGVQVTLHEKDDLDARCRFYRLAPRRPSKAQVSKYLSRVRGKPYDKGAYFGVVLAYLFHRLTGKSIRVVDQQYMCWEAASEWARIIGHRLQPPEEYPFLPRIMEVLESVRQDG